MIDALAQATPGVYHWLVLSTLIFSIGLYGLLTRRNMVGVLMSVELVLNAGALNFVVFNRFVSPRAVDGQVMALFIMAVAASEAVIGLAIFIRLFKHRRTTDVTRMDHMRH